MPWDEMPVDKEFLKRFENQTDLLRKLHTEVGKAIERAEDKIKKMNAGEPMDKIFGPVPEKLSPAAQGGGGYGIGPTSAQRFSAKSDA